MRFASTRSCAPDVIADHPVDRDVPAQPMVRRVSSPSTFTALSFFSSAS
jgi:hypothetical protein